MKRVGRCAPADSARRLRERPRQRSRDGFALIAALWLLVALSALALDFSLRARAQRLGALNALDGARGRAAARAGLATTRATLDALLRGERPAGGPRGFRPGTRATSTLDPWADAASWAADSGRLGIERYGVSARDVGTLVNVNRASADELRRFLAALRVDAGDADRIAQALVDWRDADDFRHPRGAEREEYLDAGAAMLPTNGEFADVAELRDVRGVSPAVYARVSPYLTAVGTGQVNLNAADRPVLLSLPGFGEEAAAIVLRARRSGRRFASLDELQLELSPAARAAMQASYARLLPRVAFVSRELEVTVVGWTEGGRRRTHLQALVLRGGGASIVAWQRMQ